ncbi:MAG: (d)CMP kinase [Clostridiales bacterium]|nr:(d)CMP kinase [Clostridiales bacterium]
MISVAIDGPAGAGKSTIARKAAEMLGYIYVDTGALYRTVGIAAIRKNTDLENKVALKELLDSINIELKFENGVQKVFLNGEDVSEKIRTPECGMMASAVSAIKEVREYLLDTQRALASKNNVIMDGRDIGTVILPNAQVKIFLTASPEVRAKRRYDEFLQKGVQVKFEDVLADIIVRDKNDSEREIAPLKPAEDSVIADTSNDTLEQAINKVITIVKETLKVKRVIV